MPIEEVGLVTELKLKVEELEKNLDSRDSTLKYSREEASELRNEKEQLHIFLDTLPGIIARQSEGEKDEEGKVISWTKKDYSVMIRLTSWLATHKIG